MHGVRNPKMTMSNVSPNLESEIKTTVVVFGMNTNTNTWSIVEFISPDWACILANGKRCRSPYK